MSRSLIFLLFSLYSICACQDTFTDNEKKFFVKQTLKGRYQHLYNLNKELTATEGDILRLEKKLSQVQKRKSDGARSDVKDDLHSEILTDFATDENGDIITSEEQETLFQLIEQKLAYRTKMRQAQAYEAEISAHSAVLEESLFDL